MTQVRNYRPKKIEIIQYITPDGETFLLHNPPRKTAVMVEGFGEPEIGFITTKGPYQHGESLLAYRLQPRIMQLAITYNGCTRDEYWDIRRTLDQMLRVTRTNANNPSAGKLRIITSKNESYDIDCLLSDGLVYPASRSEWNEFSVSETLEFTSWSPTFYRTTPTTVTVGSWAVGDELTFPFTGGTLTGIFFDSSTVTKTQNITYTGTFEELPLIVITGPGDNFRITNTSTNQKLELSYSIATGETVTVNLTYGNKSVTNNSGDNLLNYVTTDSNLTLFSLQPDPIVANGLNAFSLYLENPTVATSVAITYYTRFTGL